LLIGTETDICGNLNPQYGFDVWNVIFLAGHGQIPMSTFKIVMNACYQPHREPSNAFVSAYLRSLQQETQGNIVDQSGSTMSCKDALELMNDQAGGVYAYGFVKNRVCSTINVTLYSLYRCVEISFRLYDDCTYSNGIEQTKQYALKQIQGGVNDYACGGDLVMANYLNRADVREAFHVKKTDFFSVDNAEGDFDYTPSEPDLTDFYKDMNGKLRILVYNGGKRLGGPIKFS
jgi:Serine carboxypeptidase